MVIKLEQKAVTSWLTWASELEKSARKMESSVQKRVACRPRTLLSFRARAEIVVIQEASNSAEGQETNVVRMMALLA